MFKWKVSRLGGSKRDKNKNKHNSTAKEDLEQVDNQEEIYSKPKERGKESLNLNSPANKNRKFGLFGNAKQGQATTENQTLSRVGQRLALPTPASDNGLDLSSENILLGTNNGTNTAARRDRAPLPPPPNSAGDDYGAPPPPPPPNPGHHQGVRVHSEVIWRAEGRQQRLQRQQQSINGGNSQHIYNDDEDEEAIPSDSLYNGLHMDRYGQRQQGKANVNRPPLELPGEAGRPTSLSRAASELSYTSYRTLGKWPLKSVQNRPDGSATLDTSWRTASQAGSCRASPMVSTNTSFACETANKSEDREEPTAEGTNGSSSDLLTADLAHWSSHGYLAGTPGNSLPRNQRDSTGYVLWKRSSSTMSGRRSTTLGPVAASPATSPERQQQQGGTPGTSAASTPSGIPPPLPQLKSFAGSNGRYWGNIGDSPPSNAGHGTYHPGMGVGGSVGRVSGGRYLATASRVQAQPTQNQPGPWVQNGDWGSKVSLAEVQNEAERDRKYMSLDSSFLNPSVKAVIRDAVQPGAGKKCPPSASAGARQMWQGNQTPFNNRGGPVASTPISSGQHSGLQLNSTASYANSEASEGVKYQPPPPIQFQLGQDLLSSGGSQVHRNIARPYAGRRHQDHATSLLGQTQAPTDCVNSTSYTVPTGPSSLPSMPFTVRQQQAAAEADKLVRGLASNAQGRDGGVGGHAMAANASPTFSSTSWAEWTQQLQAYLAWVNSQLTKMTDVSPVQDLRTDLRSGVVLANLLEIVSGEKVVGVQPHPSSLQAMRDNLDLVLQFMANHQIRMHNITATELLEGNLKSVMRLILALAAHYKPASVKQPFASGLETSPEACKKSSLPIPVSAQSDERPSGVSQRREPLPRSKRQTQSGRGAKDAANSDSDSDDDIGGGGSQQGTIRRVKRTRADSAAPRVTVETQTGASDGHLPQQRSTNPRGGMTDDVLITMKGQKGINSQPASNGAAPSVALRDIDGSQSPEALGNFVRSGSGRKLPQIPPSAAAAKQRSFTLPAAVRRWNSDREASVPGDRQSPTGAHSESSSSSEARNRVVAEAEAEHQLNSRDLNSRPVKSNRPKALEFWESMENLDKTDFKFSTIHKMSMGRRQLPPLPVGSSLPTSSAASSAASTPLMPSRSRDREGHGVSPADGQEGASLNSSFSGPSSLPIGSNSHSPRFWDMKIPPDGASLRSEENYPQETAPSSAAHPRYPDSGRQRKHVGSGNSSEQDQPDLDEDEDKRHVEGSSDKSSPPVSLLRGEGNEDDLELSLMSSSTSAKQGSLGGVMLRAYDWLRDNARNAANKNSSDSSRGITAQGDGAEAEEEEDDYLGIGLDELENEGVGEYHPEDEDDDDDDEEEEVGGGGVGSSAPRDRISYGSLLQELSTAKKQLEELYTLLLTNTNKPVKMRGLTETEVRRTINRILSSACHPASALPMEQFNKREEEVTAQTQIQELKAALGKEAGLRMQLEQERVRLEERLSERECESLEDGVIGRFGEELLVVREAVASLRSIFSQDDTGHHILDTLEQCITVIVEKAGARYESANHSRASSAAETRAAPRHAVGSSLREPCGGLHGPGPTGFLGQPTPSLSPSQSVTRSPAQTHPVFPAKILYFMPRSATPFMTTVNKGVGDVTLGDFKSVFDRAGHYRFYIRNTDNEYGMVKEEISDEDRALPGNNGKIVLWIEEE